MTSKRESQNQFDAESDSIHLPGFENLPEDMRKALETLYQEGGHVVDSFLLALDSQQTPDRIYHYTNDTGLRGILETGEFWLTDIFGLNDPSELRHGFSLAVDTLKKTIAGKHPACDKFADNFAMFDRKGWIQKAAHFFMCAFSFSGDDLGQWRAYADNGRGYALGFDTKALEDVFVRKNNTAIPNNCTFRVTYDDARLVDLYRQVMKGIVDLVMKPAGRGLGNKSINVYMMELQMFLTLHTFRAALFFKHPAYSNEQEYRFLQAHGADNQPTVMLRSRPYSLVKYRGFDWRSAAGALKQIVIGPAADVQKARQFATDCIGLFHSGSVEIAHSEIPYRAI